MSSLRPKDSIYGSIKRLKWFKKFLNKKQKIIDLGCGTGHMITIPLISEAYNVIGMDLDKISIDYGKKLLQKYKLDSNRLTCNDFNTITYSPDVVILSEVLEHLNNKDLSQLVSLIYEKIKPGGLFLITIPNGYGLFEFESFLWNKLKLGRILEKLYIVEGTIILKNKLVGHDTIDNHPSSLDTSPHIQWFTYFSISHLLKQHGFSILEKRGGSLFSGPFSNLFFTGIKPIMKLNFRLADLLPACAADFYVAAQKPF